MPAPTNMPFSMLMGVDIYEQTKERVRGRMLVRDDLCTAGGILHGGAYMAFADTLGAVGTVINMPADARTTTTCLLYTSPSPRDGLLSRMPSSA